MPSSKLSQPSIRLEDRLVVVTGATKGIGRAVAELVASWGAHVVITSRQASSASAAAKGLAKRFQGRVHGLACDVTDPASVKALFAQVDGLKVPLWGLVNNAGFPFETRRWDKPLHAYSDEEAVSRFDEVMRVDLVGARLMTKAALKRMRREGAGSIVFVSSTPAISGYKGTPYTEAKAAVLGLMKDVAREYGPSGVRANAVAPGNIRTAYVESLKPAERKALEQEAPLRRWGEPQDVAGVIGFLLSDLSAFVTGQTLIVDGGTVSR
jgi:3-oxoacyl-[acyl-carrier protein] reductase